MIRKIREVLFKHIRNNVNKYFFLLLAFVIGVSAGAFTVNGLGTSQRDELGHYFMGFLQLLGDQNVSSSELFKISLQENIKVVGVIWVLGVSIIGIPFIFIIVGIRGFLTGFASGFIIQALGGMKGFLFTILVLLPKELFIVPSIIALGVNGINFSLNMIKNKNIRQLSKESLKTNFIAYCVVTLFFMGFIFVGILLETYAAPALTRMLAPIVGGG